MKENKITDLQLIKSHALIQAYICHLIELGCNDSLEPLIDAGFELEHEIENGDWLIQDTTRDFIFNTPDELMWNQAALSFGISPSEFSGHGGLA